MEVRIENMIFGWHEKLPEMFIELLNTLVLTKDEQDVSVGDAEKGIRPRPMFGEQITYC